MVETVNENIKAIEAKMEDISDRLREGHSRHKKLTVMERII